MKLNPKKSNLLLENGFRGYSGFNPGIPYCNYYKFLNNSRILTIYQGEAKQYKVKQVGKRDALKIECTETEFIKSKVRDLIEQGILIDK